MDKRLVLTQEQLEAIKRYNRAVKDLMDAKVVCVFKEYSEILAINGEHVQDTVFLEDVNEEEGDICVATDEAEVIAVPFGLCLTWNDDKYFGIQFKTE